jgi:hypothetical protein
MTRQPAFRRRDRLLFRMSSWFFHGWRKSAQVGLLGSPRMPWKRTKAPPFLASGFVAASSPPPSAIRHAPAFPTRTGRWGGLAAGAPIGRPSADSREARFVRARMDGVMSPRYVRGRVRQRKKIVAMRSARFILCCADMLPKTCTSGQSPAGAMRRGINTRRSARWAKHGQPAPLRAVVPLLSRGESIGRTRARPS